MPLPYPDVPVDPLTSGTWGVVLAAGGSTRMGRPKGLLALSGTAVLTHHLRRLARVCDRTAVVLGAHADAYATILDPTVAVVHNPDWATSFPSDSLRIAVETLSIHGPCLVTPVDVLPASVPTLRAIIAHDPPAVPIDPQGRRGHPVWLSPRQIRTVAARDLPGGLRTILADAHEIQVDEPWISEDFDHPDAFDRAVVRWQDQGNTG